MKSFKFLTRNSLRRRIQSEHFNPTWLTFPIHPYFIIRSSLYKNISYLAPNVSGNILDVGCGRKPYEHLFTHSTSYIGLDTFSSGHSHTKTRADCFYDGTVFPFDTNTFDSIVCFEVMEHIEDVDFFLSEISRVLKPGGMFLCTTPFAWEEHEMPYDFVRYTSIGLKAKLSKNFEEIYLIKTNSSVLAVSQLFIASLFHQFCLVRVAFGLIVIFPLNIFATFFI